MTIPLTFLSIAILILWFIIGSKGNWAIKAAVIPLTLYLCISIGAALPDLAGWPSTSPLPSKFLVHWLVVKEPTKKINATKGSVSKEGAIYVWATTISDEPQKKKGGWSSFLIPFSFASTSAPRVYTTPYSVDSHEEADGIINRIKDGKIVIGERGKGDGKGNGEGADGKKGGNGPNAGENGASGQGTFSLSRDVTFQDLPPALLPDKD